MQDAWGSEVFARREKQRRREREKKRRQRAAQAQRHRELVSVVVAARPRFDVFRTGTGLLAVRPIEPRADGHRVSVPYLQFLHGAVWREEREGKAAEDQQQVLGAVIVRGRQVQVERRRIA